MGIHVERLGQEPIVVLTYTEPTDRLHEEMEAAADEVADLMAGVDAYYRISDFSHTDMNFSTMMLKLAHETEGRRGSVTDPNAVPIFVGEHDLIAFAIEALMQEQYGYTDVAECATVDEAIGYARRADRIPTG
jgi:hypothetical protein